MAVDIPANFRIAGLRCFRLCSGQALALADFYQTALDFRRIGMEELSDVHTMALTGVGGRALRITLALGAQRVELLQFVDRPGRPYPADSSASDLLFQHFALVVDDMAAAMRCLSAQPGWTPISSEPQQLPASSGGVTAFKFRDPDGHPLELLAFPGHSTPVHWQKAVKEGCADSPFLGIDHSAISVADPVRSVAFYQSLGLTVASRSVNDDPAQARLDRLDHPVVDVIAMRAERSTPHLELLSYRNSGDRSPLHLQANDVAATCLVFESDGRWMQQGMPRIPPRTQLDPDGHHLAIVSPIV